MTQFGIKATDTLLHRRGILKTAKPNLFKE
jgi:hypothetical protein